MTALAPASSPSAPSMDEAAVYIAEISQPRYDPLPRTEQLRLARAAHDGDADAADRLLETNLRFVVNVAQSTTVPGATLMEKISAGNEGLIVALERFDPDRGFAFITYAVSWIRQRIQAAIQDGPTVRVPFNRLGHWSKWRKAERRLCQRLGRAATAAELADALQIPPHEVDIFLGRTQREVSLSAPLGPDGLTDFEGILPDQTFGTPDVAAEAAERADRLRTALEALTEREAAILRAYFGLDAPPQTLEEIGHDWGITRERVRQIRNRALAQLQCSARLRPLAL